MKILLKITLTVFLLSLNYVVLFAQPGGPGGGPGGGDPPVGGGSGIPLDGGAIFLLFAGLILFGYLKFKEKFKNA